MKDGKNTVKNFSNGSKQATKEKSEFGVFFNHEPEVVHLRDSETIVKEHRP